MKPGNWMGEVSSGSTWGAHAGVLVLMGLMGIYNISLGLPHFPVQCEKTCPSTLHSFIPLFSLFGKKYHPFLPFLS